MKFKGKPCLRGHAGIKDFETDIGVQLLAAPNHFLSFLGWLSVFLSHFLYIYKKDLFVYYVYVCVPAPCVCMCVWAAHAGQRGSGPWSWSFSVSRLVWVQQSSVSSGHS